MRLLYVFGGFGDATFGCFGAGDSHDVAPATGWADSGDIDQDLGEMLHELATLAREHGVGVLLAIDELQEVDRATLQAVNTSMHSLGQGQDPAPLLVVGAGLPSLRGILSEATSYAERLYAYWPIESLDELAATAALLEPAAAQGVQWEPSGLALAQQFSAGYPYFIQVLGKHVWNIATGAVIIAQDVEYAAPDAQADIDAGLYMARWQRATRVEQRLLKAVAECGAGSGPARMADLVTAMNKTRIQQLSPQRRSLIAKGILFAPDRGELAFTVPGMGKFVERQLVG